MSEISIRRATLEDVAAITNELRRHVQSCRVYYPSPDESVVAQTILSAFHHTSPMVVFIAENGGQIAGIGCAIAGRYLWAKQIQAEFKLVYVVPELRGGIVFKRLISEMENWAAGQGADEISFCLSSGIQDEKMSRIMGKLGWQRTGIDMVKAR